MTRPRHPRTNEIIRLLKAGTPRSEAARKLGVTRAYIHQVAVRYGIPSDRKQKNRIVLKLLKAGESLESIAESTGRSLANIRYLALSHGLKIPHKTSMRTTTLGVIADLLNTQESAIVIAERRGTTPQYVNEVAKRARDVGIHIPPRRGRPL